MLFVMTASVLDIGLTQKSLFTKVVGISKNYQTPFAVCRDHSCFSRSDGGGGGKRPNARFRAFQSTPGIGLNNNWKHTHPIF